MSSKWNDCVINCKSFPDCSDVYGNSSDSCIIYYPGSMTKIRKHTEPSASMERTSIKVTASACTEQVYGMFPSATSEENNGLAYMVVDTPDSYNIEYTSTNLGSCNFWLDPAPQCSNCEKTMFSFRGSLNNPPDVIPYPGADSWFLCLQMCYNDDSCFMVTSPNNGACIGYKHCEIKKFVVSDDYSIQEITKEMSYIAMKYISDSSTCSTTFPEILYGFTLKTNSEVFPTYEATSLVSVTTLSWIPRQMTCADADVFKVGTEDCYAIVAIPCTHLEAENYCIHSGGSGLVTLKDESFLNHVVSSANTFDFTKGFLHVGLQRDSVDNPWYWKGLSPLDDSVVRLSTETLSQGDGLYSALALVPGQPNVLHSKKEEDVEMGYVCSLSPARTF
ncbi:unnamed protein product [Caenorhabditis brenneri]